VTKKRQRKEELYQVRRVEANERSREVAEAHREYWSGTEEVELMFLADEDMPWEEVAAYFGRTIEACRQHRYELLWQRRQVRNTERERYKREHRRTEPDYVPIPAGPDEDQWWSPSYYTTKEAT
jgi:hypothetical protein